MVGMDGKVRRHKWVKVEAMNTMGKPIKKKYEGWEARVFQHEYDHLEGKVLSTCYILSTPPSVYLAVMSSRPIFGRRTSLHCQLLFISPSSVTPLLLCNPRPLQVYIDRLEEEEDKERVRPVLDELIAKYKAEHGDDFAL